MKKCPFCAEEIQDAAVKCRHCGEFLDEKTRAQEALLKAGIVPPQARPRDWYFKTTFIVVMFLCVGPLALPLVWMSPYMKTRTKWIVTLVVGVLSWFSLVATLKALAALKEYYHQLTAMYE